MRPTVVVVEVAGGEGVTRTSLEALTLGRGLAAGSGSSLVAVLIGEVAAGDAEVAGGGEVAGAGAEVAGSIAEVAASVSAYGADRLVVLTHEALSPGVYAPGRWGDAVAAAIGQLDAEVVIAPGSDHGTEVLAHAASRLDLPMVANCTEVSLGTSAHVAGGGGADGDGGHGPGSHDRDRHGTTMWRLTRLRWGGVLLEDAELTATQALLTVAPHHVTAEPASHGGPDAAAPTVERLVVELDAADPVAVPEVVEHSSAAGGVTLATARVVVSGGRGVGSAEGFAPLEELAELLGGAVGCSRVATNAGWRSHNDQVGQTGTRIAPDLYIACGISGATQHWVGCMKSKRILAINTDPEAPMVTRAHDAVIADVHDVLGAVLEQVRARKVAPA